MDVLVLVYLNRCWQQRRNPKHPPGLALVILIWWLSLSIQSSKSKLSQHSYSLPCLIFELWIDTSHSRRCGTGRRSAGSWLLPISGSYRSISDLSFQMNLEVYVFFYFLQTLNAFLSQDCCVPRQRRTRRVGRVRLLCPIEDLKCTITM